MLHQSLHKLRDEFRRYAAGQAPDIQAFCGEALCREHGEAEHIPATLPSVEKLHAIGQMSGNATSGLAAAILEAAPHVRWRQSYTIEDPGIDEHYLANYGWFNLIAPSGPFVSNEIRVSVGFWNQGLVYPNHCHEPEEIYLTVAGSALYISEGRASVQGGPGTTICHYSNQFHAARFNEAPLLAAAFWRGNGLEAKSVFEANG